MSKRIVKILYRTKRYGTWQPCSIVLPLETEDVRSYVIEDLKKQNIIIREVMIKNDIKHE